MVADRVDSGRAQRRHDLLDVLAGGRVDDARSTGASQGEQPPELVLIAPDAQHLDEEVRPIKPGDEDVGLAQIERLGDVAAHFGRGSGGQGQHPLRAQGRAGLRYLLVFRTEIVAPRRDAVGLVDRQQRHLDAGHRAQERRRPEPLGRDVHQPVLAAAQRRLPLLPLAVAQRAVDEGSRDAARPQRVDLVLHQCQKRRDHDGGPFQEQGRQLVAERFAAAGRQDGDGGPAREHRADHLLLPLAKCVVPEVLLQRLRQLHRPSPLPHALARNE